MRVRIEKEVCGQCGFVCAWLFCVDEKSRRGSWSVDGKDENKELT